MTDTDEKLGTLPYVIGGLSFIPGCGVIFGIVAITWGLVTNKDGGKKLAIIGACGIGITIIFYAGFFYFAFMNRGGVYDDLRAQLAKSNLTQLVQSIEFYKVQNGHYPEDLTILRDSLPENSLVFVYDTTDVTFTAEGRLYYYELSGDAEYFLLGVGPDGLPFTSDDILPDLSTTKGIGYRVKESREKAL